jgi:mRNA interferase MazF
MGVQRGEVYLVDLEPTRGKEIQKKRLAVIVSNNVANVESSVVVICPITDATGKNSPIHIPIDRNEGGLKKLSVAHCLQIRAVDKERLIQKNGNLTAQKMKEIDSGIKLALSLN